MPKHDWITKEGLQAAMEIVYKHLQGNWPEDDWIDLAGHNLDLNLWRGKHDNLSATLYPVENGNTDTSTWVTVFHYGNWSKMS